MRAGDILGALTAEQVLGREHIGKINLLEDWSYVAVRADVVKLAQRQLGAGIKGRSIRAKVSG